MKNSPDNFYKERLTFLNIKIKSATQKSKRFVSIRLLIAVAMIVFGYLVYPLENSLLLVGGEVVLLAAFVYLVQEHTKVKSLLNGLKKLLEINENELKYLDGHLDFADHGAGFLNFNHQNAYDLDLFGKKSLYQRLNRTTTIEGSRQLANDIINQDDSNIIERQDWLKELSLQAEWRQEFQSVGLLESENSGYKDLKDWFKQENWFQGKTALKLLANISPLVFLALFLAFLFNFIPKEIPTAFFFLQLAITGTQLKKINFLHGQLSKKQSSLNAYEGLLKTLAKANFKHETLNEIKKKAEGGADAIARFKNMLNLFDSRLNMIMGVVLNGAFLWDIRFSIKVEEWKNANNQQLEVWINAIAKMESINSMANYVFNHPDFVWPTLSESSLLDAKHLGHPFLKTNERVCNDFNLLPNGQVVLLSGANMSGKSTFLRTVGLNMVMAKLGLPVCAAKMEFKPLPVFTSMRINDSLQESESYFFAELKRLKYIIDTIKKGDDIFILMDEILRGTNSNDKHEGSAGLIKQLIELKTSGIVASHDITLSALDKDYPNKLLNRSFEVENKNGELVFDYKLRVGVCQNLNASYLMKKMGILG